MKYIFTNFAWMLLFFMGSVDAYGHVSDDLYLRIEVTTGERSRDSSSQTTTIIVERNSIVWERRFGGRLGNTPRLRKEFRLSRADKKKLVALVRSRDMFVTKSITLPPDTSTYEYFAVSFDLSMDNKKGAVAIEGPRTALTVKEEKLYEYIIELLKSIYRIITPRDKNIFYEELIRGA